VLSGANVHDSKVPEVAVDAVHDDWELVIMNHYLDNQFYVFNMPLTSFLVGFIKGEILVPSLSNEEESSDIPVFEPSQSA
jgi:hypothetical protein